MSDDVALDLLESLNRISNMIDKQNDRLERIEMALNKLYGGMP